MLYRKGGRNHERNCRIPRLSPPPTFCTKAKVAKRVGVYLWDTTVHIALFQGFPTVQLFIICSTLQAMKNWMAGSPGNEAKYTYIHI